MKWIIVMIVGMVCPLISFAQTGDGYLKGLHIVLDKLYIDMMPMCKDLISVSRAIAGFAAVFYIGSRVWQHIANAEAVEVYPLLRPFVVAFIIAMFPQFLNMINGVMKPTVLATAAMIRNSDAAMKAMLEGKKKVAMEETRGIVGPSGTDHQWEQYGGTTTDPSRQVVTNNNPVAAAGFGFGLRNMFKRFVAYVLELLYEAAALCINTIRTFELVVLSILGPLVFGLSVFDGFQHILRAWVARYLNIYLWLPIANIFGAIISKIQEQMIVLQQQHGGDPWFSDTNTAYLVFLVISILGFATVPSVANYIMHAGTPGSLLHKVTSHSRSVIAPVINGWMGRK
jgi:conjugative transposon TraJ protein